MSSAPLPETVGSLEAVTNILKRPKSLSRHTQLSCWFVAVQACCHSSLYNTASLGQQTQAAMPTMAVHGIGSVKHMACIRTLSQRGSRSRMTVKATPLVNSTRACTPKYAILQIIARLPAGGVSSQVCHLVSSAAVYMHALASFAKAVPDNAWRQQVI